MTTIQIVIYVLCGLLTVVVNYLEIFQESDEITIKYTDIAFILMVTTWWPLVVLSKLFSVVIPEDKLILFKFIRKS